MTSCGDDDNTSVSEIPNTYEVTLSAVLPECTADFFTLDFEYTNAEGSTTTATLKKGDQSDAMSDKMKAAYENGKEYWIGLMGWENKPERWGIFDKLIIKKFTFNVPSGKSFSYKVIAKVRTDYSLPSEETFDFMMPFVYLESKRISGNCQDNSVFTEELSVKVAPSLESGEIASLFEIYDGAVINEDSRQMN